MLHKVYITKEFNFEAAHFLPNYQGPCANVHGHSYKLQVQVSRLLSDSDEVNSNTPAEECMVLDFKHLKSYVKRIVLDKHDHEILNNHYTVPTAEFMVLAIYKELEIALPANVELESVKLWETAGSSAEYRGEERSHV